MCVKLVFEVVCRAHAYTTNAKAASFFVHSIQAVGTHIFARCTKVFEDIFRHVARSISETETKECLLLILRIYYRKVPPKIPP